MKLKFYLRGIGIGIIVTVAICICAGNGKKEKMTDAQIRARAIELGMVDEGSVIADTLSADSDTGIVKPEIEPIEEADTNTDTDTETEASALEEITTTNDDDIESGEELDQSKEELTEQTEASDKPDAKEEKLKEPVDTSSKEMVTITVEKGNGSDTVARKLKEAGLVDDAVAYDKWLIENGYDRRISAGSHIIPVGASKEEIARIISGG